jgi:hypothetical protein
MFRDLPIITIIIWRVYPKLSQLTKAEMTSEAASQLSRVSGQVDQFPLAQSLNTSNEGNSIQSHEILTPMIAIEHRLQSSCNNKITLLLNGSIHGASPTKSRDDIRVNFVTYSMIKRTSRGEPAQSKLTSGRDEDEGKKKGRS